MKVADQKEFVDENGIPFSIDDVRCISTYKYFSDGFFEWECTVCFMEQKSRAHKINGVVFKCRNCKNNILLLRSDIHYQNGLIAVAKRLGDLVGYIEKCQECGSQPAGKICDKHLDEIINKMQEVVNIERTPSK